MEKQYLTIENLTNRYQVTKRTIYRWMVLDVNPFPRPKIRQKGTTCLWCPDQVTEWEESQTKAA